MTRTWPNLLTVEGVQGLEHDKWSDATEPEHDVTLPFTSEAPSDAELRIAQVQLVGWLEGLFHGIQATLFTQQMQAQQQFEEMRQRRALEPGNRPPGVQLQVPTPGSDFPPPPPFPTRN